MLSALVLLLGRDGAAAGAAPGRPPGRVRRPRGVRADTVRVRCSAPGRPTAGRTRSAAAPPAPPRGPPERCAGRPPPLVDGDAAARLRTGDPARRAARRPRPDRAAARAAHPRPPRPLRARRSCCSAPGSSDAPLDVLGPGRGRRGRPGCGWRPTRRCSFVAVAAGETGTGSAAYDVRVLAAAHGTPRVVRALRRDRSRADGCSTPPTPGRCPTRRWTPWRGAAFDVVLLEETFGDHVTHGTDHLDLRTFPDQLRRLRAAGAVTPRHRRGRRTPLPPQPADRRARPTGWRPGAPASSTTAPRCGARHRRAIAQVRARDPRDRRRAVGQVRARPSGLLAAEAAVTYVATAYPADHDDEWSERVRLHRARRPAHWSTLETTRPGAAARERRRAAAGRLPHAVADPGDGPARRLGRRRLGGDRPRRPWPRRSTRSSRPGARRAAGWSRSPTRSARAWCPTPLPGRRFRDVMGRLNAARRRASPRTSCWCMAGRVTRL